MLEAGPEPRALVSRSEALSPVLAFPEGRLVLSHGMTSLKGPACVALMDSKSQKVVPFDLPSNLICKETPQG